MARSEELDLRYYVAALRRRYRLVLLVTAGCVAAAMLLNLTTRPIYRATSAIEVRKEPGRSLLTGEAIASDQWQSDNIAVFTAAQLITNRTFLREVATNLGGRGLLHKLPGPLAMFSRRDGDRTGASSGELDEQINWLAQIVAIKPVRDTRIVNVEVEHWNPQTAREINETLIDAFVAYQTRQRDEADSTRHGQLALQMGEAASRIHTLERNLNSADQAGVPVLEEEARQLTAGIGGLNNEYVKIQADRLAAGARRARVREALSDSLTDSGQLPVQSPALDDLWRSLLDRQTDLARARPVYRDGHPKVQMLVSEIRSIRDNIHAELSKTVSTLDQEYSVLLEREKSLRGAVAQREDRLRQLNGRLAQQATLQSEVKSTRDLYDLMATRIQQDQVSAAMRYPLVAVVQRATLTPQAVRPRKLLNLVLGLLVGMVAGAGLALLQEYVRRTIRTPSEAVVQLELPVLGIVPKHS